MCDRKTRAKKTYTCRFLAVFVIVAVLQVFLGGAFLNKTEFISRSVWMTSSSCGNRDAATKASAVGETLCGGMMGCSVGAFWTVTVAEACSTRINEKSEDFLVGVFFGGESGFFSWSARRFHKTILADSPRRSLVIWACCSSFELSVRAGCLPGTLISGQWLSLPAVTQRELEPLPSRELLRPERPSPPSMPRVYSILSKKW